MCQTPLRSPTWAPMARCGSELLACPPAIMIDGIKA
jgi:hypothetical protein